LTKIFKLDIKFEQNL